jgi:hypothetical protein
MAEHQSADYTVCCVIIGDDDAFTVNIQSDATVDELKKAIMAKKQYELGIATYRLTLYLVNIPDDDNLVVEAKKQLNTQRPPPLWASTELSTLFPETPAKGKVHILVRIPDSSE